MSYHISLKHAKQDGILWRMKDRNKRTRGKMSVSLKDLEVTA